MIYMPSFQHLAIDLCINCCLLLSYFSDKTNLSCEILWSDITSNKELVTSELNPDTVADTLFETKDLRTDEHDEIMKEKYRSLRVKLLLDIMQQKNDKGPFMEAIFSTGQCFLVEKLKQLRRLQPGKLNCNQYLIL